LAGVATITMGSPSPVVRMGQQPKRLGQLKTGWPVMAHMNSTPRLFLVYLV
jgi:hypothetical protein